MGLRRSPLLAEDIEHAKQSTLLTHTTMSLFYATDFYDQLENTIVPALRAGSVVLADRYIFTLMVRDIVRGADPEWLAQLYSKALVPDAVFRQAALGDFDAVVALYHDQGLIPLKLLHFDDGVNVTSKRVSPSFPSFSMARIRPV